MMQINQEWPAGNPSVYIPCPKCDTKFRKEFRWLKESPKFPCPACAAPLTCDGKQLAEECKLAERSPEGLRNAVSKSLKIVDPGS